MILEDWELAEKVKSDEDEDALGELCNRHSGIFIKMVHQYGGPLSETQKKDLIDEKTYHIYMAAKKYDRNRPKTAKFSTYLASQTMYSCFNTYSKHKRKQTVCFDDVEFQEESDTPSPDEECCDREKILSVASQIESLENETEKTILKERYYSTTNSKLKPWSKIAAKLGLSVQGCINIHNSCLLRIRKNIQKDDKKIEF